jgi:hypothetical protein
VYYCTFQCEYIHILYIIYAYVKCVINLNELYDLLLLQCKVEDLSIPRNPKSRFYRLFSCVKNVIAHQNIQFESTTCGITSDPRLAAGFLNNLCKLRRK